MPKPQEVAELAVRGVSFQDWDTVEVVHRWKEGWPTFKFTSVERAPLPTLWTDMQFKTGDPCIIWLGGQQAIDGIILHRQTAYDAKSHAVQLAGAGKQWLAATSSIKGKDNNFDKMSLTAIAKKVAGTYGVNVQVVGAIDETPFDRLQAQPGELVFDFLDRIARMRGAHMGSDHLGNLLLIGKHIKPLGQNLVEGENILKLQCVFSIEQCSNKYSINGQFVGTDDQNMRQSSEMSASAQGIAIAAYKYLETVAEQPVKSIAELEMRANYEAIAREGTQITVHATVQGWLRDGVNLWRTGDQVLVYSPMAMLDLILKIQSATFTQSSQSGTLTELELVLPWMLGDQRFSVGPNAPQPPKPAKPDTN